MKLLIATCIKENQQAVQTILIKAGISVLAAQIFWDTKPISSPIFWKNGLHRAMRNVIRPCYSVLRMIQKPIIAWSWSLHLTKKILPIFRSGHLLYR